MTASNSASDRERRSYYVDYYQSEMNNGGFSQFVYNSRWSPTLVSLVRDGGSAMNAVAHLHLFDEKAAILERMGPDRLQAFLQVDTLASTLSATRSMLAAIASPSWRNAKT